MSSRSLFGTDGMRGVANVEPMTGATVTRLGMAIAARLRQPGRHTRIAIGKDTRLSGYMFESALAAGIVSMGADVWLTGPLPTPGIAFITASMRCDAGVVMSASHNPFEDNGIKVFARDGYKLPDQIEAEIEALMGSAALDGMRAAPKWASAPWRSTTTRPRRRRAATPSSKSASRISAKRSVASRQPKGPPRTVVAGR